MEKRAARGRALLIQLTKLLKYYKIIFEVNVMRLVIKVGTSTLAHGSGKLNMRMVEWLCRVIADSAAKCDHAEKGMRYYEN